MWGNTADRLLIATFVSALLALPTTAAAGRDHDKPPRARPCKGAGERKNPRKPSFAAKQNSTVLAAKQNSTVPYVFKGLVKTVDPAGDSVAVAVAGGNCRARRFAGQDVTFVLAQARLRVRDSNGDGKRDLEDIVLGDRALVKARVPLVFAGPPQQQLVASKFVDKGPPGVRRR